ncbi:MAG: glycoside hydrolase family 92 protein, partial [Ignavibacteriales bacterium]|nr:glycoside hydrolase family 92 protein [Ignavibacteriales bacterium]
MRFLERSYGTILSGVIVLLTCAGMVVYGSERDHTQYVNSFIGTDAHGHTFPGATVPFGMVQLSPDTRVEGWDACAGYHYSDSTILGFSHTHLSGTGIPDYGDILVAPTLGEISANITPSRFHHQREEASPGYYSVWLDDSNIRVELTATTRVGVHRYTFPKPNVANIIIDLHHGLGPDKVIESEIEILGEREVVGYRRSEGWAKDQHIYFVAQFSKPFESFGIMRDNALFPNERSSVGKDLKCYLRFFQRNGDPIIVKVGISAVSVDGARKNLEAEVPGWDFDSVRENARKVWEKELSKIEVGGGTRNQLATFYTALYHAMLAPNIFSDVDHHYRGMDGKIHVAEGFNMYTVFSLWDTFRAEHPLLTIIDRERTRDFVNSLLSKYQEGNTLPVWELAANETWCMIGYHSIPVIVDAFTKGIGGFDAGNAVDAMKQSALADRYGLAAYREKGYIPGDVEGESVSKTLEYAYDDWCIDHMRESSGANNDVQNFVDRAQSYKNVFDPSTGFMRAKTNACWVEPFDPSSVTVHYTEANAWQYSFFVPQDVDGLITLMGGKEKFIQKLDSLFGSSSSLSGRQQADITGMIGQYAQGNEPSHHAAYLYDYAGVPWKTQRIVRMIMDSLYKPTPDGLCGNDDCGQMSAWYVLSAMGLYQVCPGQPMFCIGSPLFSKVVIHSDGEPPKIDSSTRGSFVISATNNSQQNRFIQSAKLNGGPYTKSFLTYAQLVEGGLLEFDMGSRPA